MQTRTKLLGATAACAACCAVSVVPALFAGGGLAALGGAAFAGREVLVVALAVVAVAGVLFWRKRSASRKAAEHCGCGSTCAETGSPDPSCALPTR